MKRSFYFILISCCTVFFISGCGDIKKKMEEVREEADIDRTSKEADRVREGKMEEDYHANGQLKTRGRWVINEEGKVVEHGLHETWYKDGKKAGEYRYIKGTRHGNTVRWHDNGVKAYECTFDNGKPILDRCFMWLYDGTPARFR